MIQRWFRISAVSDNTDISFQRYVLPNNFSFEPMRAVGYSADSELALYLTTLIQNKRCILQHWFGISAVSNSSDSRIFTFEYEYLGEFETEFENILGCESRAHLRSIHEKTRGQNLVLLSL
jgi:hypothetical protein